MGFRAIAAALISAVLSLPALSAEPWPALVDAGEMGARYTTPGLRIVDLRPAQAYSSGHVDGAVSMPMARWTAAASGGLPGVIGDAGIHPERPILLVHSDTGPENLAELAWVMWELKGRGVRSVSILSGGMAAWVREGARLTDRVHRHGRYRLAFDRTTPPLPELDDIRLGLAEGGLIEARLDDGDATGFTPGAARIVIADLLADDGLSDPVGLLERVKNAGLPLGSQPLVVTGTPKATTTFWLIASEVLGIEGVVVVSDSDGTMGMARLDGQRRQ